MRLSEAMLIVRVRPIADDRVILTITETSDVPFLPAETRLIESFPAAWEWISGWLANVEADVTTTRRDFDGPVTGDLI